MTWLTLVMLAFSLVDPAPVLAQSTAKPARVGFLAGTGARGPLVNAFREGLRDLGWIEGQNVTIESRFAEGGAEDVPHLAADLSRQRLDVIVVGAIAIREVKAAMPTTATVFVTADDPVAAGYAATLARPGGHMTALTSLNFRLDAKRLEILKAALPHVARVGVLVSPHDPSTRERVAAVENAARAIGVQVRIIQVPQRDQLSAAFALAARERVGAVMVLGYPPLRGLSAGTAELAARTRVPVISAWREFPEAGGLMSYGTNASAMFRRAASYVDRILKGVKPGELPIDQASTFEFVVNARTARALGLTIPQAAIFRADQVID